MPAGFWDTAIAARGYVESGRHTEGKVECWTRGSSVPFWKAYGSFGTFTGTNTSHHRFKASVQVVVGEKWQNVEELRAAALGTEAKGLHFAITYSWMKSS